MPSPAIAGNPDDGTTRRKVTKKEKEMGLPQGFSRATFPNGRKCFMGPDGKKINSLREVVRRNPEYYAERASDNDKGGESSDDDRGGSPALNSPEGGSAPRRTRVGSRSPALSPEGASPAPRRTSRVGARKIIKAGAHGVACAASDSGKIGRSRRSKAIVPGSRKSASVSGDRLSIKRNPRMPKGSPGRRRSRHGSPEEDLGEARSSSVNMKPKRLRPRGSSDPGTRKPVLTRRPKKELSVEIPRRRRTSIKKGQEKEERFDDESPGIGSSIAVSPSVESNSNASRVTLTPPMDKPQQTPRSTTKGPPYEEKHYESAEEEPLSASIASPPPLVVRSPASLDLHAKRVLKKPGQGRSARLLSVPPATGSGVGAKVSRLAVVSSSGRKSPLQAGVRADAGSARAPSKSASRSSRSPSSRRSSLLSASPSSATGPPEKRLTKKATKKRKLERMNEARNQVMTTQLSVNETNWIVEARLGISQYGPLCPQMRCLCGDKEYTCAAKLTQAEGEPVANKLVEAFSLLKDELCTKYASEIEHSKSSALVRKRARPQQCRVEHDYESKFLESVVPFQAKQQENPYEKLDYPPVPILHDKNRFFVDHLSSRAIRGRTVKDPGMISVINNGGYITSMSIMDDILAVGTQDSDMLLRIDERKNQGPNIIHFWCLKTMKRLFSLYHQGRAVRSLSWITNSRTDKRAGLLCVLSITGSLEIFVIPSHLKDGSFVTFGSFWDAPVGRATVDGAPKGLLSYHVYVWNQELWVLGGLKNGMINVWKIDDRQEDEMTHPGGCFGHPSRTFSITACCWLEAKNGMDKEPLLFATGDLNCMVCIWDRQDTVPLSQTLVPGTGHCYIRELTWTALDINSIYIRHQSVCVWNLTENSIHDIKSKQMGGHGEEIAAGYVVDYDAHLAMGSITVWNHGTVMRGVGGCTGDGRELLQSWTFRSRQPMEKPSLPADSALTLQDVAPLGDNGEAVPPGAQTIIPDISTVSKPDEQLVLYRAFIRTLNLIDGLKDANTEYLRRMRFWEHDDMSNKDDARNGEGAVEIFGPGINELVDPVPLTAIASEAKPLEVRQGITLGRFMAVGSAAGLITVTRVLPLPAPPK